MKYIIKNVGQSRPYQYQGTQLVAHAIMVTDNNQDVWCDISMKAETPPPRIGEELEGSITYSQNPQYAHKFKKTAKPFAGKSYGQSPEVRAEIIRQNALTNAVNYWAFKNPVEATIDDVIETAKEFAKYSSGLIENNKPATTTPPQTNTTTQPTDQAADSIDISDIPF